MTFSPSQQPALKDAREHISNQETLLLKEFETIPDEKERIAQINKLRRKVKDIFMELSGLEFWGSSAEKIQQTVIKGSADLHALASQHAQNTATYRAAQSSLHKQSLETESAIKDWQVGQTSYKYPESNASTKAKTVQQLLQTDPLWLYKESNKAFPLEAINRDMPTELKAEMASDIQGAMEDVKFISTAVGLVGTVVVEGAKAALCGLPKSRQRENCKCVAQLATRVAKSTIEVTGLKEPLETLGKAWNDWDGSSAAALLMSYDVSQEEAERLSREYNSDLKHLALLSIPIGTVGIVARKGLSYTAKTTLRKAEEVVVENSQPLVARAAKPSGQEAVTAASTDFSAVRSVEVQKFLDSLPKSKMETNRSTPLSNMMGSDNVVKPQWMSPSADYLRQCLTAQGFYTRMISNLEHQALQVSKSEVLPINIRKQSFEVGETYGALHRDSVIYSAKEASATRDLSIQSLKGHIADLKKQLSPVLQRHLDEKLFENLIARFQTTLPQVVRSEFYRLLYACDREGLALGMDALKVSQLKEAFTKGYAKQYAFFQDLAEEQFYDIYWSLRQLKELSKDLAQNRAGLISEEVLARKVIALPEKLHQYELLAKEALKDKTPKIVHFEADAPPERKVAHAFKDHYKEAADRELACREGLRHTLPPMQKPEGFPTTTNAYTALKPIQGEGFECLTLNNTAVFKIQLNNKNSPYKDIRKALNSAQAAKSERIFLFWDPSTKFCGDTYSIVSSFNRSNSIVGIDTISGFGKKDLILLELKQGTKMASLN